MKNVFFAASVVISLFVATTAYGQTQYYLPQVANGSYGDGRFRTTFILFNNTNASVAATLKLSDPAGNPLALTIPGMGTLSIFMFNLESGALRIVQTDGSGSLVTGTASITATAQIGVSGIFTVYDGRGNFASEAGVGNSPLSTDFILPVEITATAYSGLALGNSAASRTNVTFTLQNAQGASQTDPKTSSIAGNGQFVRFVTDSDLFPGTGNFQGTLAVQSAAPVAALSLKQNSSPPSYSSLPVVERSSAKRSINLAHVANGAFAEGSFRTSFFLFNPGSQEANAILTLTRQDGTPWSISVPGYGTNSAFQVRLPGNGLAVFQTDGSGPLTSGGATITSDAPIGASAMFTVYNLQGRFSTEAGVGDSPVFTDFTFPVDSTGFFESGAAFFNPTGSPVTLTLKLLDANGNIVRPATAIPIPAHGQTAQFLSQLFPGISSFRGTVAASAPGGLAAMTLRQYKDNTLLCYTTMPVVAGAAAGKASSPPLLTQTKLISNVRTDIANVYGNLQSGFRLSGTAGGTGVVTSVVAVAGNQQYTGAVDSASGRYAVPVPAGAFELKVGYQVATSSGTLRLSYSETVQVAGNTTQDITLPPMPVYRVSGTVSGLNRVSALAPALTFWNYTTEGIFAVGKDGTYQGALPEGTYWATLTGTAAAGSGPAANLAIDLDSVTITGDTSASFDVPPTATLSGTVNIARLSTRPGATVTATDTRVVPPPQPSLLTFTPGVSVSSIDVDSGQYRLVLADNREYKLQVATPVTHAGVTDGAAIFTIPTLLGVSGDTSLNFNLDATDEFATITGIVLDPMNRRANGIRVTARSQGLPNYPNLTYVGTGVSDSLGNYAVQVLVGNIYEMTYTPPLPTP